MHGCIDALVHGVGESFIADDIDLADEEQIAPDRIIRYLNDRVRADAYPSEYAVAIFVLIVEIKTGKASYSGVGFQNAPIVVHLDGTLEYLVSQGLPITKNVPEEAVSISISPTTIAEGAYVFLATDGVYEQTNKGVIYEQRLLNLLARSGNLPENTVADRVRQDFYDFLGSTTQDDDVTFLVLSSGTPSWEEFVVPGELAALQTVRERASAYYAKQLQDPNEVENVVMGIHELAANAIEHGTGLLCAIFRK